jgi:hypothetical protein
MPASKAGENADDAQEEDNKFSEAERCLMIFGASHA